MGFESRCSILNGQVIYIEKTKLKTADMWLIPLDRVTYCFDPKLHVWFCYKIWKGVFRAHCTQIWGTSRLAFGGYMLVLHYQVHGEERFPKLFSYEKLFVRFAKYQNAKRAHCTKSESTTVPGAETLFLWFTHTPVSPCWNQLNLVCVVLQNITTQAETDKQNRAKQIIVFSIIMNNNFYQVI